MDQAKRGADALSAGKYDEAVKEYTAAIAVSPTSPDYFIKRSIAHQRSSPANFQAAFSDAENAVLFAQNRAKRELIVQAQLRRGIALFGLERYADAGFVISIVKRMDPSEKTLQIWENKIAGKLAGLEETDLRSQVTVKETPEIDTTKLSNEMSKPSPSANPTTASTKPDTAPPAVQQTPASKIRHDWYQNTDNVYFTLLAKGVPKDKATIDIQPHSLTISFPLVTDSTYDFSLEPLFAAIDPSASSYNIMSTKVEIILKKATPGQKWSALESSSPLDSSSTTTSASTSTFKTPPGVLQSKTPTASSGPSYPTSSRTGPKDWDKLADSLTATKKKSSSSSGKENEVNDEEEGEGGDAVNSFFKKLYSGASPDVQRAMMKSYTESNGTALSTNWEEVSKGPVETSPPDGMTAKKWS